jgi:hypothetical protein
MPSSAKRDATGRSVLAQILIELRSEIHDDLTGRRINQATFYRRCQEIEGPPPDDTKPRTGVCFPATNVDVQRDKIRVLETGKIEPTPGQRRIFEQLCDLEPNFLDQNFLSVSDFQARRKQSRSRSTRTSDQQTTANPLEDRAVVIRRTQNRRRQLSGIRILSDNYELSPGRKALLVLLQRKLRPIESKPVRIIALQGPAGVGKSQAIAEWWKTQGRRIFVRNVFTLNCERKPGDQIFRALTAHFLDGGPGPIEQAIEGIRAAATPLIILDGLVKNPPGVPGLSEFDLLAPTDADSVALSSVRTLIQLLAERQAPVSLLLAIQTDRPEIDALRMAAILHAGIDFSIIPVPPLAEEDGAHMLQRLGVDDVPPGDLMRVSRSLMGLPISLEAAAKYLSEASSIEREQFITQLNMPDRDAESFSEFFQRYMALLCRSSHDLESHPYALLRLLALMPGPVPKLLIENLLEKRAITRLRNASLDQFLRNRMAFVANVGDRVDLHPLVRRFLRGDLDRIARGEITDPTTNRDELAWIHRTVAEHCLRQLPASTNEFTAVEADNIESAVYHLLSLRELMPADRRDNIAGQTSRVEDAAYRKRILNLECTGGEIVRYCLDQIVARYFFGRGHHLTRVLGQFETKARILTYFLEGHNLTGEAKNLSAADWSRVLLEISICWMHAGRLLIAELAIQNCVRLCVATRPSENYIGSLTSDADARRIWSVRSEAISIACIISARQARDAGPILSTYDDDFSLAEDIGALVVGATGELEQPLLELSRAARRLVARRAHLELLRGNVGNAISMFERAVDIEKASNRKWLVGDAGRRHIQALIRRTPDDEEQIAQAEEILNYNFRILHPPDSIQSQESNEIISLLTMKSTLFRVRRDYGGCDQFLREALDHRFIRFGECTFSARMELEVERFRLQIVTQQVGEETIASLRTQSKRLREAHHMTLAVECDLLLSELLPVEEREPLLQSCERTIRNTGWLLRCEDIDTIRAGESAVARFHC